MTRLMLTLCVLLGLGVPAGAAELTLKRVMLSSGGVGYFEYEAAVDGNETLGLDVPLGQVDDILKSLVVFDSAGGVAGVELPGRDNTVQAFGDAPFGPEALESATAYLNALRGVEVTVQGNRPMTGRIVSAEPDIERLDPTTTRQRTRVTLLGANGLSQFVLESADSVQVTDPALRARIEHALESLRQDSSLTTRHLTIRLKGMGKRTVSVGYVAGAPLWKATYRLMLPVNPGTKARLQGWATLENQSGADWKRVTLTLQYGNPVTFRQALYRSYFVQRPEVPIEILGHVLPDIDTRAISVPQGAASMGAASMAPPPMPAPRMAAAAAPPMAPAPAMAPPAEAAIANEGAEETTFTLAQPVDLAAGHTANVPIIDRDMPADRIGLVPFRATHPLASIRIRNDDTRALPAGVLTLYDASGEAAFAGDARLGGLPAGESRLLSFAQDLRTTIETDTPSQPNAVTLVRVANGVLNYTVRMRQVIKITATAPARDGRDLLLEIPKWGQDDQLTSADGKPAATEQTATAFRAALTLAPDQTRTVTFWHDHPTRQALQLIGPNNMVEAIIQDLRGLDPKQRAALDHIVDLRHDEAGKRAEVDRQRKLLDDVQQDEDRVRKNLGAVAATDALHSRLTRALDSDETRIEQLRKAIDDATTEADKASRSLADAVAALNI